MHESDVAIREAERGTSKLRELRLWARDRPVAILASALDELDTAIGALRVSGEELRAQEQALDDAKRALSVERRRWLDLFDFAADPWLVTDLEGTIIAANRAAGETLGSSRCVAGESLSSLFVESDRRRVRSCLSTVRNLETAQEIEARVLDTAGAERVVLVRIAAILEGQPLRATGYRCAIHDHVTERTVEVLRKELVRERSGRERADARRQRLASFLDIVQDPLFALDSSWRFVYVNHAAARMFAATGGEDLLDRDIWNEIPDAIGSRFYKLLTASVLNGERSVFSDFYQPTRTRYNIHVYPGSERTVVLLHPSDTPRSDDGGPTSEPSELVSGVARFMNTYLVNAIAEAEQARSTIDAPEGEKRLDRAMASLRDAARLMNRLLAYTRQQVSVPTLNNLNAVLQSRLHALESSAGPGVTVTSTLYSAPLYAEFDRQQIGDLLDELVRNAVEAIGERGEIAIRSSLVRLPAVAGVEGRYAAMIEVRDDGPGMTQEVLGRAVEPFFTTKDRARVAGLGLSMASGIAAQSKGSLTIRSRPGHGTTVRVLLPVLGGAAAVTPGS